MRNVQSVIFLKSKWGITAARIWLKAHKYVHTGKVDTTPNYHRFRQFTPDSAHHYRIQTLGKSGVKLVVQYKQ